MSPQSLSYPADLLAAVHEASEAEDPDAVYIGTGVCTRSCVATGDLPLDALAMMLLADREREARGASIVVHLIADSHALVNSFADRAAVGRAAEVMRSHVERAALVLGLRGYHVVRASEVEDQLHQELHAAAREHGVDPYAAREAADVEWARRKLGATVKIGWTMNPDLAQPPTGYDERYFDQVYRDIFGDKVSCVYGHPGRRVDTERPRTSPYANEPGEKRLTIGRHGCSVAEVCASKSMRHHLRPLMRELYGSLGLPQNEDLASGVADVLAALAPSNYHNDQEVQSRAA